MKKKTTFFILCLLVLFSTELLAQNTPLTPIQKLGKELFFDKIADPDNQSCASCHDPSVGFVGAIPGINKHGAVYSGAIPQRFGNRKPPSSAYITFSPILHYDALEELFIGGNFWDGRATGERLGSPAAEQALGPFLNPVEQNNASPLDVLKQILKSEYAGLWQSVWGEPLTLDPNKINDNYDKIGLAIAEYEGSSEVNQFSSKFDYYLDGLVDLTPQELIGMELFNGDAMCSACHPSDVGPYAPKPLFTDFTFDNLGTPKNPENPFYRMDQVFLPGGSPINPLGPAWIDLGLGGFLATRPDYNEYAVENMGKHKVPTLRNVDKRPGNGFTKAYLHNGVFKSLKEVVHFYNTRDILPWPPPEVAANVNDSELGNLGLSENDEDAIVAFMQTLTDGYKLPQVRNNNTATLAAILTVGGPNPFNPSTILNYFLPEDANVIMEAYNISGEKVITLQNGFMSAGNHQVIFDAGNFSSGLYIVTMQTGKQFLTQKLMLMK